MNTREAPESPDFHAELSPLRRGTRFGAARFELALYNLSDRSLSVQLSSQSSEGVELNVPAQVGLQPGERQSILVEVRPASRRFWGAARTRAFAITATAAGDPPRRLEASIEDEAARWLPLSVGGGFVAGGVLALAFLLAGPTSTAGEGRSVVATATPTVTASATATQPATATPTESATATATLAPADAQPAATATDTPEPPTPEPPTPTATTPPPPTAAPVPPTQVVQPVQPTPAQCRFCVLP